MLNLPKSGPVEERFVLGEGMGRIGGLAVPANGRLLATRESTARLWNLATGAEERRFTITARTTWIRFHPAGRLMAIGAGGRFWDLPRARALATLGLFGPGGYGEFTADGERFIFAHEPGYAMALPVESIPTDSDDKSIYGFDRVQAQGLHLIDAWGLAASPDGRRIATAGHDHLVKIWDAQSLRLEHTLSGHDDLIWCAEFSPDSRRLATGSARQNGKSLQGEIGIWDVETGERVGRLRGHEHLVRGLAFDPRGRGLFSASTDGSIRIWQADGNNEIGVLHDFDQLVHDLAFSADGNLLAAACDENQIAVWDLSKWDGARREDIPPPRFSSGHVGGASAVAFSRDGLYLADGAAQGEVTLWRRSDFARLITLRSKLSNVRSLSFSVDNDFLAAGSYVSGGIVWDLQAIRARLRAMNLDW